MFVRALNFNWLLQNRSLLTRLRSTGAPMGSYGSRRWPIIRLAWTTMASPAGEFDIWKTRTATANTKHRRCCFRISRFQLASWRGVREYWSRRPRRLFTLRTQTTMEQSMFAKHCFRDFWKAISNCESTVFAGVWITGCIVPVAVIIPVTVPTARFFRT